MEISLEETDLILNTRKQIECQRCRVINWHRNLDINRLCPFCVGVDTINNYFKKLNSDKNGITTIQGEKLTEAKKRRIQKQRDIYILSLNELKEMIHSMDNEEKKEALRDLGFDSYNSE